MADRRARPCGTSRSKVRITAQAFSPDDKTILVTSNEKGGFDNVALLDVASQNLRWVTDLKWEAEAADFSPDGKWLTYSVNEDGRADAYLAPLSGGAGRKLPIPIGLNTFIGRPAAFSPSCVGHASILVPRGAKSLDLFGIVPNDENEAARRLQSNATDPVRPKRKHVM